MLEKPSADEIPAKTTPLRKPVPAIYCGFDAKRGCLDAKIFLGNIDIPWPYSNPPNFTKGQMIFAEYITIPPMPNPEWRLMI